MCWIAVVPVRFSVQPAFTPCRTKNVASVTMKLGSCVRTTVTPLSEADRDPEQHHDHDRGPDVEVAVRREVAEQQARAADHHARREVELAADHQQRDRHGDDAVLRGLVGPAGRDRRGRRASRRRARSSRTRSRRRPRRSSRRCRAAASSRASGLTRVSRSSGGAVAVAAVSVAGASRPGGRAPPARPARHVLARALGGELGDLRRVRLVDDPGPGEHGLAVADRVEVRDVEHREHDRQVALEVLLLVDREQQPAGLDLLDRAADVERARLRALRDDVEAAGSSRPGRGRGSRRATCWP